MAELRRMLAAGRLDLPLPGAGATAVRWAALADAGRRDLCLGRLAEGHADALAILAEAGRRPEEGALYGVWASRFGGQGAHLDPAGSGNHLLRGTVAFCSGAGLLDRALVVGTLPSSEETCLVEVDLADPRVAPVPGTWPALGMDASASMDVAFSGVPVAARAVVGPPGFYTGRPGFLLGGAGVAAVWLGGAVALLDAARESLSAASAPDPHRLAALAELSGELDATDALLARSAAAVDRRPAPDPAVLAGTCRSVAERAARRALELVPLITGPSPLSRRAGLAQKLADLQVYILQYHGGADRAGLGRLLLRPGGPR